MVVDERTTLIKFIMFKNEEETKFKLQKLK